MQLPNMIQLGKTLRSFQSMATSYSRVLPIKKPKRTLINFILREINKIRRTLQKCFHFLTRTASGKALSIILGLLGYALVRYYKAYYEIFCSKRNPQNLEILRHLKPRLKDYNPTFYVVHPMLNIILGDSKLNDNFIIKFKREVIFDSDLTSDNGIGLRRSNASAMASD